MQRSETLKNQLKNKLPELLWLERLLYQHREKVDLRIEHKAHWQEHELPLYSLTLGNTRDSNLPTFLITAGLHGIERIGTHVVLAWLQSLLERLEWDADLKAKLEKIQLVIMPVVNPVGMYLNQRSNGNGVDLNRNSPIEAEGRVPWLAGGHRLSSKLPWYRGQHAAPMQEENLALERLIRRQIYNHPKALVLDLHSGLGLHDRLWFPYAFRRKAIANIDEYLALKTFWERSFPDHTYIYEPQSIHYRAHGDLWDYFHVQKPESCEHFLALTLELGSWAWVKKRPQQLFNMAGLFNPQKHHRRLRVQRRHLPLFDFLISAMIHTEHWLPNSEQSTLLKQLAKSLWYDKK